MKKPSLKFLRSKKFLISAGLVVVLCVGVIIGLMTVKNQNLYKTVLSHVSEARYYMKSASSDNLNVQFYSGMREEPYAQDGVTGTMTPFAIINVDPKDASLKNFSQISGTVQIGDEQIPITLDKNPYDVNFATDISRLVDSAYDVTVTLNLSETDNPTFTLVNAMDAAAFTWQQALQIATDTLTNEIKNYGNYEVYVKIINNPADGTGAFWYVQFITAEGNTHFCVIAADGSVVGSCIDE